MRKGLFSVFFLIFLLVIILPSFLTAAGPGDLTLDLELWLKADDGINESDGEGVDIWSDQSGQDNHATQTVATSRPTYEDDADSSINHNPVVYFDGTNDYLSLGNLSAIKGGSDYTLYAVGVRNSGGRNYVIGSQGGHQNQDLIFGYGYDTDPNLDRVVLGQWGNGLSAYVDAYATSTRPFMTVSYTHLTLPTILRV